MFETTQQEVNLMQEYIFLGTDLVPKKDNDDDIISTFRLTKCKSSGWVCISHATRRSSHM